MDFEKYLGEIDHKEEELCGLSDSIWGFAETAYNETKSVEAMTKFLKKEGFTVTSPAYGIDTAFTASFGEGSPRIGILGEYDALAGLSQKSGVLEKDALIPGESGHGCGHNLLGVGSVSAALSIKAYLQDGHKGTVIFYGCPAEEGGSGKAFMAKNGAFKDLDCALTWHPGTGNRVVTQSSLANFQVLYSFEGISAHAAGCPELGRSALDAVELMNVGCNFLREHMIDEARVHYAIVNAGGFSPNVVQSNAKVLYLVRAPKQQQAFELLARVDDIAKGAALMTGCKHSRQFIKSCANTVLNPALEEVLYQAMQDVGVPEYTDEERELAKKYTETVPAGSDREYEALAEACLEPENRKFMAEHKTDPLWDFIIPYEKNHPVKTEAGSTDVGDCSWQTPTAQIRTGTFAPMSPGHSWQIVSQGKSSVAHKGMLFAGKSMALAGMRLMEDPELLTKAREVFKEQTAGQKYIPIPEEIEPVALSSLY